MTSLRIVPLIAGSLLLLTAPAHSRQVSAPAFAAEGTVVEIRDGTGADSKKVTWTLSEAARPDIYTVALGKNEKREVCYVSNANSFCRTVRLGDVVDFDITHGGKIYPQRLVGKFVPPMAVFDKAYREANRGKIGVAIPEAYELVNIAIALTPKALGQKGLVIRNTPYHDELMAFFEPVKDHPFILALDKDMWRDDLQYFRLKMNALAFEFDRRGKLGRSPIYNRAGFSDDPDNHLLPYFSLMGDFAEKSNFRQFFRKQQPLYQSQINFYRNELNVEEMLAWLRGNFPAVQQYDTTKIIFSPLVGFSQSATWIETKDFRELQAHINYPYPGPFDAALSPRVSAIWRGGIAFTELNHGFINPTADLYAERITAALNDRSTWIKPKSSATPYDTPMMLFNEMMNWGLISLYVVDKVPADEQQKLIDQVAKSMGETGRGFPRFPAFNTFLVDLYRNRPAGATLASLYPKIVEWFEAQAKSAPVAASTS